MKHSNFTKQDNRNAASFSLADVGAKLLEESDDVTPGNIATDGPGEDQLKGPLVPPLHPGTVPAFSAGGWWRT